jgi:hypothetical protein
LGGVADIWPAIVRDFSNIGDPVALTTFLQVLMIDLVLAGDNAIVVGALAAGLPAIGTAAVGIRVQGDHSGSAARSQRSAAVLAQIGQRLRAERTSLKRAADLTEQAARAMLGDLDEWQLLNQQHDLSVG